jgi:hypothetical protein
MDIETGGINKPIFALGAVVFVLKDDGSFEIGENILLNFAVPEEFSEEFYEKKTWDTFWGPTYRPWDASPDSEPIPNPNFKVLQDLNKSANCSDEKDLITQFYSWWMEITSKYDIKIVTDSPTFDVGYTDLKIYQYKPNGNKSLPLVHQWKSDGSHRYVSTYDYNTFELLFEETFPADAYSRLDKVIGKNPYNHDHNPLNDSLHQAFQFAKLYTFMKRTLVSSFNSSSTVGGRRKKYNKKTMKKK